MDPRGSSGQTAPVERDAHVLSCRIACVLGTAWSKVTGVLGVSEAGCLEKRRNIQTNLMAYRLSDSGLILLLAASTGE